MRLKKALVTQNVTSAAADWFVDPFEGVLHLAGAKPAVFLYPAF
jgi:hypothetical protein